MIKFSQKDFSSYIASDALKGATIGTTVGSIAVGGMGAPMRIDPSKAPRFLKKPIEDYNSLTQTKVIKDGKKNKKGEWEQTGEHIEESTSGVQNLAIVGTATLIGAALGAIVGGAREIGKRISRTSTDARLMADVIKKLEKLGYKEGQHFTRDPKTADLMKTKVCVVITRDGADFKALINVLNDPKLKSLSGKVIKGLTGSFQVKTNIASNKYNEINISTISKASSNVRTVSEIASGFIKAGYPVYLVEVG